jgi:hypothetical protein
MLWWLMVSSLSGVTNMVANLALHAIGIAVLLLVLLLAVYWRLVRLWTMRWGATTTEAARPLPGDQLMTRPGFSATRAITIAARPEHIWPWLVQLGSGRAGWYAIDRINNARVPSAQAIRPELYAIPHSPAPVTVSS